MMQHVQWCFDQGQYMLPAARICKISDENIDYGMIIHIESSGLFYKRIL